jgi:hypothetical protein
MTTRIAGSLVRGAPVARSERVRTYATGRVCSAEGCFTILSIYNPSRFCGVHSAPDRSSARRKPLRPLRQCACDHCGAEFETTNPVRKYCSDRCRMAAFAFRQRTIGGGRTRRSRARREVSAVVSEVLQTDRAADAA